MKKLIFLLLILPAAANASDALPLRKAGLWEVTITQAGMPTTIMKQCTDAAVEASLMETGKEMAKQMGGDCTRYEVKKEGSAYVAYADCSFSGIKMSSKSVFSGDFNSSYSGVTTAKYDPPMMGMKETESTLSGKYVGACDKDLQPGDIVMQNGMKMNFKDLGKK